MLAITSNDDYDDYDDEFDDEYDDRAVSPL